MDAKFHLALPCENVEKTRDFYIYVLGAKLGRNTDSWVDVNLYGNQVTFTASGPFNFDAKRYRLGKHLLPSFHFGVILDPERWDMVYSRLTSKNLDVTSEITFFENKTGEHLSFFVTDPNGYVVEFKCFKNAAEIFRDAEEIR